MSGAGELVSGIFITTTIMAGMSSSVDPDAFYERLKNPYGIAVGIFSQYVLLPSSGFALVTIFDLSKLMSVSVAVLSTMPGGSISNFWCFVCGADLNLSVACTAASTLLSVVFIPINLTVFIRLIIDPDGSVEIAWLNLIITIISLYCGLFCGLYLSWFVKTKTDHPWHAWLSTFKDYLIQGVSVIIIGTLFFIVITNLLSASGLRSASAGVVFVTICLSYLGFFFGASFSKMAGLPLGGIIAVAIETSNQNIVTAGVILRLSIEDDDEVEEATAVLIVYALCNMTSLAIMSSVLFYTEAIPRDPNDQSLSLRELLRKKQADRNKAVSGGGTAGAVAVSSTTDMGRVTTSPSGTPATTTTTTVATEEVSSPVAAGTIEMSPGPERQGGGKGGGGSDTAATISVADEDAPPMYDGKKASSEMEMVQSESPGPVGTPEKRDSSSMVATYKPAQLSDAGTPATGHSGATPLVPVSDTAPDEAFNSLNN